MQNADCALWSSQWCGGVHTTVVHHSGACCQKNQLFFGETQVRTLFTVELMVDGGVLQHGGHDVCRTTANS